MKVSNNLMTLILLLLFVACSEKQKSQENNIKSITCDYISLDGEREIYKIEDGCINSNNKKIELSPDEKTFLSTVPEMIQKEDLTFGCGTCVDGTDFRFVFQFSDFQRMLTVEAGYKQLPDEINDYVNELIEIYDEQI